jgi:hypothetical protein
MPKPLFYAGTAFCLFLALAAGAGLNQQLRGGPVTFVAVHGGSVSTTAAAALAIVITLFAGMAAAAILLRMAALLAARNLFAAFLTVFCVAAAIVSVTVIVLLQSRMLSIARRGGAMTDPIAEVHFAAVMMLGYFLSMSFLALRPYFRIQASRFLSALVFFPLPLFILILAQEMLVTGSRSPLPSATPASLVFFGAVALLFFAIALHCIRHRHLFLEMTNLRELLESRIDQRGREERTIGGVAFDS